MCGQGVTELSLDRIVYHEAFDYTKDSLPYHPLIAPKPSAVTPTIAAIGSASAAPGK